MGKSVRRIVVVAGGIVALFVAANIYNRPDYPYGWSHCCDKGLLLSLTNYADKNDGWFPRGEATPEASLSLLYRHDPNLLVYLPGKTVSESVVRARLEAGQLLTPETCDWHYIEGLRSDDPGELALFWDKVGLGHNGQRLPKGGHQVGFVNGSTGYVSGTHWQQFLARQERLRAQLKRQE